MSNIVTLNQVRETKIAAYGKMGELREASASERSTIPFRTSDSDISGSISLVLARTVIHVYFVVNSDLNNVCYRSKMRNSDGLQPHSS